MSTRLRILSAVLALQIAPVAHAQLTPGYAMIDGTQNPPQVVSRGVNVQVTDNGPGNYTLVFEEPVVFFLASPLTSGPFFDAGSALVTAILDSSDPRRVDVRTHVLGSTEGHPFSDGQFSVKVLSFLIYENGFED